MTTQTQESFSVPPSLETAVNGALQWINTDRAASFEITGLIGEEHALNAAPGEVFELGLVLCDGELCACEQVRFKPTGDNFEYNLVESEKPDVPALLDPPPGIRASWLDEQLAKHEFLLLLFYRGRW
ncbi:MAG: hypothetical protein AAF387_14235 [Pseudomonadota bacterium]